MPEPDYHGEKPVYRQIVDPIADRILNGELRPRQPIPSETTLMQEWPGVARTTVRRGVAWLRKEGLIYTVPGRGSFVNPRD